MTHAAEIKEAVSSSLQDILVKHQLVDVSFTAGMIAILLNDSTTGENKSAIFLDLSSFPAGAVTFDTNTKVQSMIDTGDVGFTNSGIGCQDVTTETRSLILDKYHPVINPNRIFLLSSFPTNGAAGKVDRSSLAKMARERMATQAKSTSDGEQKMHSTKGENA